MINNETFNQFKRKWNSIKLELVEQINEFRKEEAGNSRNRKFSKLTHYNLLKIIRKEFEEEIAEVKIYCGSYKDSNNQDRLLFYLSIEEAKQILIKESKYVRKAIIQYLNKLEKYFNINE